MGPPHPAAASVMALGLVLCTRGTGDGFRGWRLRTGIYRPSAQALNKARPAACPPQSRLKATQKKMQDLIRKTSSNTQLALIIALIVILVILAVFAFM